MEGKAKFIFPVIATATDRLHGQRRRDLRNLGFRADFVRRWLTAYIIGWPVGATTGLLVLAACSAASPSASPA